MIRVVVGLLFLAFVFAICYAWLFIVVLLIVIGWFECVFVLYYCCLFRLLKWLRCFVIWLPAFLSVVYGTLMIAVEVLLLV